MNLFAFNKNLTRLEERELWSLTPPKVKVPVNVLHLAGLQDQLLNEFFKLKYLN